jgi:hypothetical protein
VNIKFRLHEVSPFSNAKGQTCFVKAKGWHQGGADANNLICDVHRRNELIFSCIKIAIVNIVDA